MTDPHTHARLPYTGRRHTETVPGAPALAVSDLEVAYPGAQEPALSGVTLTVPAGARVALVGGNGSGKSTLLRAIAGVLPARRGVVLVGGSPIGCCRHRVAFLAQHAELDWSFPMSASRLVLTGRYSRAGWLRRPGADDRAAAARAMDRLDVADLAERTIGELSGGQRQRVLLARALAAGAELLLLDEPLTAMDAGARETVGSALADLASDGVAMIVATHDLGSLDADFDGAVYLAEGREVPTPPGGFSGIPVGGAS